MKKIISLLIATLLVFSLSIGALADSFNGITIINYPLDSFDNLPADGTQVTSRTNLAIMPSTTGTYGAFAATDNSNKCLELRGNSSSNTYINTSNLTNSTDPVVNELKFKNTALTDELFIQVSGQKKVAPTLSGADAGKTIAGWQLYANLAKISCKNGVMNVYTKYDINGPYSKPTNSFTFNKDVWNKVKITVDYIDANTAILVLYLNETELGVWNVNTQVYLSTSSDGSALATPLTLQTDGFQLFRAQAQTSSTTLANILIDDFYQATLTASLINYSNVNAKFNNFDATVGSSTVPLTSPDAIVPFTYSGNIYPAIESGRGQILTLGSAGASVQYATSYEAGKGYTFTGQRLISFDFKIVASTTDQLDVTFDTFDTNNTRLQNAAFLSLRGGKATAYYAKNQTGVAVDSIKRYAVVYNIGAWNNAKILLDSINGRFILYINDIKIDSLPITTTGANPIAYFSNFKISSLNGTQLYYIDNFGVQDVSSISDSCFDLSGYGKVDFFITANSRVTKVFTSSVPVSMDGSDNNVYTQLRVPANTNSRMVIARYESGVLTQLGFSPSDGYVYNNAMEYNIVKANIDVTNAPMTNKTTFKAFLLSNLNTLKPLIASRILQ